MTSTNLDRRRFLVAASAGSAALLLPATLAEQSMAGRAVVPPELTVSPDQPRLLPRAIAALDRHRAAIADQDVIGIVDFREPSRKARFDLVDVANGRVIGSHLVAHGNGSDPENSGWVQRVSNQPDSNASSIGAFVAGPAYRGKHGRSRRLLGLDPQNSMAESRGIVIHAASYVGEQFAAIHGRVGRSQGCFAVAEDMIDAVLARLGPGRMLFAWT